MMDRSRGRLSTIYRQSKRRPDMKHAVVPFLLLFVLACTARQEPTEYYQVLSHQATSGEWTFIRVNNEEHTRVQITATCDFYKSGENEPVEGPKSCNLFVGQTLVPNRLGTRPGEFLDVWQLGDTLFITRGQGSNRVHQQFTVRSAKVIG